MTGLSSFAFKRININGNERIQRYTTSIDNGLVSTRDNRVFNGSLGRSLRSFAQTAHSAHSLCSAPFTGSLTHFAHSLVGQLKFMNLCSCWNRVQHVETWFLSSLETHPIGDNFCEKKKSNVPKLSWYSSNFWYQIYRIDIIDCDNQELEGRWKSQRLCTSAFLSWFPFLQKLTIKHRKSLAAKFCR